MDARPIVIAADDDKAFLKYLSILLDRMNLEVLSVSNAGEAIELSRVTRPSLLTMDMMIPGMDALEALHRIRGDKDLADLPVIMISSYQEKNKQWQALSLGCIDVLDKPVDLRRLHKAIQRCDLYPGGRRRYLRAPFAKTVSLHHQDQRYQVSGVTLSERGIFLSMSEQLAKSAHVDIELTLPSGAAMQFGGSVIYGKVQNDGGSVISWGTAIKFDRLSQEQLDVLSEFVTDLLIGDLLTEQTEPFVSSD